MLTAVKTGKINASRTVSEWTLDIYRVVFLPVIAIITVYPFWNIFLISINDATDAVRGGLYFWPRSFSLYSNQEILSRATFQHSVLVTLARTFIDTSTAALCIAMCVNALSRKELVGVKFRNLLFTPCISAAASAFDASRFIEAAGSQIRFSWHKGNEAAVLTADLQSHDFSIRADATSGLFGYTTTSHNGEW